MSTVKALRADQMDAPDSDESGVRSREGTSRIAAMVEAMPDDWKELLGRMEQRTREMIEKR